MLLAIVLWTFSLPFAADKKEWEEEAQVLLGVRKVLHSLGQASEKLRKTSTRLQGQAEEVCLQQSEDQSPRVWNHHRKVGPEAGKGTLWDKDIIIRRFSQGHIIFRG